MNLSRIVKCYEKNIGTCYSQTVWFIIKNFSGVGQLPPAQNLLAVLTTAKFGALGCAPIFRSNFQRVSHMMALPIRLNFNLNSQHLQLTFVT